MSKRGLKVVVLLIGLGIVLAPIIVYGPVVNVAVISMGLSVSGTGLGSSSDVSTFQNGYVVDQLPVANVALDQVGVEVQTQIAYDYLMNKITGPIQVDDDGVGDTLVEIIISFSLTTPSNQTLTFDFNPFELQGTGSQEILVELGPDELAREVGSFTLEISIHVTVTPPGFDNPIVDLDLNPVSLDFTLPQQ